MFISTENSYTVFILMDTLWCCNARVLRQSAMFISGKIENWLLLPDKSFTDSFLMYRITSYMPCGRCILSWGALFGV